jgi:hypothetical protein
VAHGGGCRPCFATERVQTAGAVRGAATTGNADDRGHRPLSGNASVCADHGIVPVA